MLGDIGGLSNVGVRGSGGREAPGLKLKAGSAIRPVECPRSSVSRSNLGLGDSIADWGRLPLDRDRDDGADEGEGSAGKLKGGFGGGALGSRGEEGTSTASVVGDRWPAASVPIGIGADPTGPSKTKVVAMIALAAPRRLK